MHSKEQHRKKHEARKQAIDNSKTNVVGEMKDQANSMPAGQDGSVTPMNPPPSNGM
jgi:hypothetical protein